MGGQVTRREHGLRRLGRWRGAAGPWHRAARDPSCLGAAPASPLACWRRISLRTDGAAGWVGRWIGPWGGRPGWLGVGGGVPLPLWRRASPLALVLGWVFSRRRGDGNQRRAGLALLLPPALSSGVWTTCFCPRSLLLWRSVTCSWSSAPLLGALQTYVCTPGPVTAPDMSPTHERARRFFSSVGPEITNGPKGWSAMCSKAQPVAAVGRSGPCSRRGRAPARSPRGASRPPGGGGFPADLCCPPLFPGCQLPLVPGRPEPEPLFSAHLWGPNPPACPPCT